MKFCFYVLYLSMILSVSDRPSFPSLPLLVYFPSFPLFSFVQATSLEMKIEVDRELDSELNRNFSDKNNRKNLSTLVDFEGKKKKKEKRNTTTTDTKGAVGATGIKTRKAITKGKNEAVFPSIGDNFDSGNEDNRVEKRMKKNKDTNIMTGRSLQTRRADALVDAGINEIGSNYDIKKGLLYLEESIYSNPENQRAYSALAHLSMGPESILAEIGTKYNSIIQKHQLQQNFIYIPTITRDVRRTKNYPNFNDYEKMVLSQFNDVLDTLEDLYQRGKNDTLHGHLVANSDATKNILWKWVDVLLYSKACLLYYAGRRTKAKEVYLELLNPSPSSLPSSQSADKPSSSNSMKYVKEKNTEGITSIFDNPNAQVNENNDNSLELEKCYEYIEMKAHDESGKSISLKDKKSALPFHKVKRRIIVMCVASEERPALTLLRKSFEAMREEIDLINTKNNNNYYNEKKENQTRRTPVIELDAEFHVLGMNEPYPGHEAKLQKFTAFVNALYDEQIKKRRKEVLFDVNESDESKRKAVSVEKERWSNLSWSSDRSDRSDQGDGGSKNRDDQVREKKKEEVNNQTQEEEEVYIVAIDAYDVVISPRLHELPHYLDTISKPIVFAAEQSPWPDEVVSLVGGPSFESKSAVQDVESLPTSTSISKSSSNIYLNSGSWCGRLEHVNEVLEYMKNNYAIYASDQRAFTRFFLQHPNLIHLDQTSSFLYTTHYTHVPILMDISLSSSSSSISSTNSSSLSESEKGDSYSNAHLNKNKNREKTDRKVKIRSGMKQSKMPAVLHANAGDGKSLYGRLLGTYASSTSPPFSFSSSSLSCVPDTETTETIEATTTFMVVNTPYFNGLAMHSNPTYNWYTAMNFIYHLRMYRKLESSTLYKENNSEAIVDSNEVTKSLQDVIVDNIDDNDSRSRVTSRYFYGRSPLPYYIEAAYNAAFMMMNMRRNNLARIYLLYTLRQIFDLEFEKIMVNIRDEIEGKKLQSGKDFTYSLNQVQSMIEDKIRNSFFSYTISSRFPLFSNAFNNLLALESRRPANHLETLMSYLLDIIENEHTRRSFNDNSDYDLTYQSSKSLFQVKLPVYISTLLLELVRNLYHIHITSTNQTAVLSPALAGVKSRLEILDSFLEGDTKKVEETNKNKTKNKKKGKGKRKGKGFAMDREKLLAPSLKSKERQRKNGLTEEIKMHYNPYVDFSFLTTPPASLSVYENRTLSREKDEKNINLNVEKYLRSGDHRDVLFSIDTLLLKYMPLPNDEIFLNNSSSVQGIMLPHETEIGIGGAYLCLSEADVSFASYPYQIKNSHKNNNMSRETLSASSNIEEEEVKEQREDATIESMLLKFASNLGYNYNAIAESITEKERNDKEGPTTATTTEKAATAKKTARTQTKEDILQSKVRLEMSQDVITNWGRFLVAVNEGRKQNICPFYT